MIQKKRSLFALLCLVRVRSASIEAITMLHLELFCIFEDGNQTTPTTSRDLIDSIVFTIQILIHLHLLYNLQ